MIQSTRIAADIEAIASHNEVAPAVGYSRPTFSPEWAAARDYVIAEAEQIGCAIRIDAAGNVHARPKQYSWQEPLWLSGSHIDSVPTGGKYDGVVGIVAPLEVLRAYPATPLELIIFAEEEGTTFNLGMLGSRAWVGTLSAQQLAEVRNKHGQNYWQAGANYGASAERLANELFDVSSYRGLIELHVEQGLAMWKSNQPVAVVNAINGRRQYFVTLTGVPNHAGSTQMADRNDALVGAAECILALQQLGHELNREEPHTVVTVGRLNVEPNGINVIPGRVRFSIDFRARTDAMLEQGDQRIHELLKLIASGHDLPIELDASEALPAMPLNESICGLARAAATKHGIALPTVASGALHDAAILAPYLPTAMLFVASRDGISHNPAEYSRIEDIALATELLAEMVNA
jgi:hydantoinase/carbamoylase family amidase